ncbi:hypothetical protein ACFYV7_15155 [Nocardia suismassiliense]|uniref:Uncharacterized protein n=1 Tax=Nocardia suismassiliense TaxID=2077092 RepID=A0ABW6QSC2_9NOCA
MSDIDLQRLAAELVEGRSPTVWFTADAVGVQEGGSGKLIAIADPAEPDHLRVKPAGSADTLAFSPAELTLTRPARRQRRRSCPQTASLFDI